MKRLVALAVAGLVLLAASLASAGSVPAKQGNDVIIPAAVVKHIDGFDPKKDVYVAYDGNGWAVSGMKKFDKDPLKAVCQADGNYVAPGMAGKRFNLFQIKDTAYTPDSMVPDNIGWLMIHDAWPDYRSESFLDSSHPNGPCFKVN